MTRSHCCQFSAHYGDWFKMTGIPSHMYTQMVNYRFNSMERTGAKNTNLGKMWEGEHNEKDWQLLIVLPWLNVSLNGTGKKETRLENERLHRGKSPAKARDIQYWVHYTEAAGYPAEDFWTSAIWYFCFIMWNNMVLMLQIRPWMLKLVGSSSNKYFQISLTSMPTGVGVYVIAWSTYTRSRFYGTKHCNAPFSALIPSEWANANGKFLVSSHLGQTDEKVKAGLHLNSAHPDSMRLHGKHSLVALHYSQLKKK